jgi:hypothetical protein
MNQASRLARTGQLLIQFIQSWKIQGVIATALFGTSAFAEPLNNAELLKTRPPRDHFWSFDMSTNQYNLTAPDESKLSGIGGEFAIGYGRIYKNSWLVGSYHFLSGPWDTARNQTFDVDSSGMIVAMEYGTSFPKFELRSGSSPFLSISAGYLALNSKNVGSNRKNSGNPNDINNYYLEQDFIANVNAVVVIPSLGWNWVKAARPTGNEPDLLLTRVESAYLRLGAMIPLYSRARVKVIKRSPSDPLSQTPKQRTTTGVMKGYSLTVTAGVWLGI